MDVMDCNELVKLGPTRWAEQQIKKAHKILVFLSPGLLRLCGTDDEDSHNSNQVEWGHFPFNTMNVSFLKALKAF